MSEEPQPSQDSQEKSPGSNELKALIVKGIVGTIALAGTTAIPILVQKALDPPAPAASPVPITPAQVAPTPPQTAPLEAITPPENITPPEVAPLLEPAPLPIPDVTAEADTTDKRSSERSKGQRDNKDDKE